VTTLSMDAFYGRFPDAGTGMITTFSARRDVLY
jgi:hypothetical protein